MTRLLIHVEGQTEESFVNEVLRDHLLSKGYHSVSARIVGNARQRGGIRPWVSVRTDIRNHLLEDPGCVATTMVDYYGLPQNWPGRAPSRALGTVEKKARCVQDAVKTDLAKEMGHRFDANRFVPFVVMHEFEGLLFSDCAAFSHGIGRSDLEVTFAKSEISLRHLNTLMIHPTKRLPSGWPPLSRVIRSLFTECSPCWRPDCIAFARHVRISMDGSGSWKR